MNEEYLPPFFIVLVKTRVFLLSQHHSRITFEVPFSYYLKTMFFHSYKTVTG